MVIYLWKHYLVLPKIPRSHRDGVRNAGCQEIENGQDPSVSLLLWSHFFCAIEQCILSTLNESPLLLTEKPSLPEHVSLAGHLSDAP